MKIKKTSHKIIIGIFSVFVLFFVSASGSIKPKYKRKLKNKNKKQKKNKSISKKKDKEDDKQIIDKKTGLPKFIQRVIMPR